MKSRIYRALSLSISFLVCTSIAAVCFLERPALARPARKLKGKSAKSRIIQVKGSKKIAFTRFFFATAPGAIIGTSCSGCGMETQFVWMDNIGPGVFDGLVRYGNKYLRDAGYDVMFPKNLLFGEEKVHHARYILGAWVSDLRVNTAYYVKTWDSGRRGSRELDKGMGYLSVSWQLYDTFTEKVVYREKTKAKYIAEKPAVGLVLGAFTLALRKLLASQNFVNALAKDKKTAALPPVRYQACKEKAVPLPEGLEKSMKSVVTLKVGNGYGSGFIVSEDGLILTAAHVVRGADEILVRFRDGKEEIARVKQYDHQHDAALLQLPGRNYPCTQLSKITPKVGSDLFVIGAPASEKFSFSVARGILSGHQKVDEKRFIQTDASVNPGNSGGPMLSNSGRAVGIVSWKVSGVGMEGLGFGVPIDVAQEALKMNGHGVVKNAHPQEFSGSPDEL